MLFLVLGSDLSLEIMTVCHTLKFQECDLDVGFYHELQKEEEKHIFKMTNFSADN